MDDISTHTRKWGCVKGALLVECVHIDASTEPEIPGTDYHPFHRFCQGSWLAAVGCQAHNPEQVQRRVWATQEISVWLQSGGCIALLEPHARRCKCSKTHNTNANAGVTVADLRFDRAASRILPWNFATSRADERFAGKRWREVFVKSLFEGLKIFT